MPSASNNIANGAAIDWLRYLEINRSEAQSKPRQPRRTDAEGGEIDGVNPQKSATKRGYRAEL
jgi:hypothetical protein